MKVLSVLIDFNLNNDIPVLSLLSNFFEQGFAKLKPTDLLKIPEDVRRVDHNLKHQALYGLEHLSDQKLKIMLGDFYIGFVQEQNDKALFIEQFKNTIAGVVANNSFSRFGIRMMSGIPKLETLVNGHHMQQSTYKQNIAMH